MSDFDDILRQAATRPSIGFGDTVAKITHKELFGVSVATVVHKFTEVTGVDCGCVKRLDTLNEVFPYKNGEN